MDSKILKKVEEKYYKERPEVNVGDTIELYLKIKEGNKERLQVFKGIVLAIKGSGLNKNLVVRKISYGIGVEKIIPLHSPTLEKVEIIRKGKVRRSKLYYMRDRVGKKAMKVASSTKGLWTKGDIKEDGVEEEQVQEKQ